jgi:hypothetical protein
MGTPMTNEQFCGMRMAILCGQMLQRTHPEIVEDYRAGLTANEIAIKHDVLGMFELRSQGTAKSTVSYALGGDSEGITGKPYEGLLDEEERQAIISAQNWPLKAARKGGIKTVEDKVGLHGLTKRQRKKNASTAGTASYDQGKGIHARSDEDMTKHGLKGARTATANRNQTAWEEGEKLFLHILSKSEAYRNKRGINPGECADLVNRVWHDEEPVRTGSTCSYKLWEFNKTYQGLEPAIEKAKDKAKLLAELI